VLTFLLVGTYDGPVGSYDFDQVLVVELGTAADVVAFADSFEAGDNGWTHGTNCTPPGCDTQDDWQRGAMGGASAYDPPAAFDGTNVWANDRGATIAGQPWNGDYRARIDNWLLSPSIDCSALSGVTLSFMRWLSVESSAFDVARVLVNGTEIWRNPVDADLLDTAWTPQDFDISALADGNPDVRIRFELDADGGLEYGGWTLDQLQVVSRGRDCEPYCSVGTVPGPVGRTVLRARRSGPTGVVMSWTGETVAAGEEFRLYRGTRPDLLAIRLTPSGHAADSFDDAAAPRLGFYRVTRGNCAGEASLLP
jgi:hypothetical protein